MQIKVFDPENNSRRCETRRDSKIPHQQRQKAGSLHRISSPKNRLKSVSAFPSLFIHPPLRLNKQRAETLDESQVKVRMMWTIIAKEDEEILFMSVRV